MEALLKHPGLTFWTGPEGHAVGEIFGFAPLIAIARRALPKIKLEFVVRGEFENCRKRAANFAAKTLERSERAITEQLLDFGDFE
jgi:hypothetical protein